MTTQIPISDAPYYRPHFSPWLGHHSFATLFGIAHRGRSLVSSERCYILARLAQQALTLPGIWYEAGVYRGGTAAMLAHILAHKPHPDRFLRLFDTFEGMPETNPELDVHKKGEFADVDIDEMKTYITSVAGGLDMIRIHKGLIPQTFAGLEDDSISLAHVDVDIHDAVRDCCEFIYPRLIKGGFMIFDDYGFSTCPGAKKAVDDYFADKPSIPIVLHSGQAIVFKS